MGLQPSAEASIYFITSVSVWISSTVALKQRRPGSIQLPTKATKSWESLVGSVQGHSSSWWQGRETAGHFPLEVRKHLLPLILSGASGPWDGTTLFMVGLPQ